MSTPAPAPVPAPATEPVGTHGIVRTALFLAALCAVAGAFILWNWPPDQQTNKVNASTTYQKAQRHCIKGGKSGKAKKCIPVIGGPPLSKQAVSAEFDSSFSKDVIWAFLGLAAVLFLSAGFYNRPLNLKGPSGLGATIGGTAAETQLSVELARQWEQQGIRDTATRIASANFAHLSLATQSIPFVEARRPGPLSRLRRRGGREVQYEIRYAPSPIPPGPEQISAIAEQAIAQAQSGETDNLG
jgi:hypothetical protein